MIRVNDKWEVAWQPGMTIHDLLAALQFTHQHIVISVNDILVPAEECGRRQLDDGDQVRVIHIIGGG